MIDQHWEVVAVTAEETASSLDDCQRRIEIQVTSACDEAEREEFSKAKKHVLWHAGYARGYLRKASDSLRGGDRESAWAWLVQASHYAGSATTALDGVWPGSAHGARRWGVAGGRAAHDGFKAKQAQVAKAFLELPRVWATRLQASQELERLLFENDMGANPTSRRNLWKAHPEVEAVIKALPNKAKPTRR